MDKIQMKTKSSKILEELEKIQKKLDKPDRLKGDFNYQNTLIVGDLQLGSSSSDLKEMKTIVKNILKDKKIMGYLNGENFLRKKLFKSMYD